jgi:cytoskeleton protein RodZ
MVVIKAKGLTWIAVTDSKGVTLLRKTLSAGETASASSVALPLWVVVGRADNAEVQVRGETVTLEPSVPDNVARFKVQ